MCKLLLENYLKRSITLSYKNSTKNPGRGSPTAQNTARTVENHLFYDLVLKKKKKKGNRSHPALKKWMASEAVRGRAVRSVLSGLLTVSA